MSTTIIPARICREALAFFPRVLLMTAVLCPRRTIVIDVGKSFLHSAVEWFPKYGLRQIDAVLLTHAHADGASFASAALVVRLWWSLIRLSGVVSDERLG